MSSAASSGKRLDLHITLTVCVDKCEEEARLRGSRCGPKFAQGFTALAAYEFVPGGHVVEIQNNGAHRHVLGLDKVGYFPSVVLSTEGLRLTLCVFE